MVRSLRFTSRDAANIRFGRSCLWEVLASLRVLRDPAHHSVHLPWVRRVAPRLAYPPDGFGLLRDLVGSGVRGDYAPDLLTPAPTSLDPSIEDELRVLRDTSPAVVGEQLDHLRGRWTSRLRAAAEDPERALEQVAEAVRWYWTAVLEPFWAQVTAVADAEVFRRGRQQAGHGTTVMLDDLHERIRWDGSTLTVAGTRCLGARDLEGGGLCLVPSAFVWPSVLVVVEGRTAQLAFPCRGVGTLWTPGFETPRALEQVLGRSKARLLALLDTPLSVSEAAARAGLSVSATSEHIAALRRAGLVRTRRDGRHGLTVRTSVADALLGAAG